MSRLDALLVVLLALFALRGWARGFFRESFSLAGILVGAFAAAAAGPRLGDLIAAREHLPPAVALAVAWAVVFLGCVLLAMVLGRLLERLVRALFLGGLSRAGGVVVGSAKGAALLGLGLLVAERRTPALAEAITTSRLGPPLVAFARAVIDAGRHLGPPAAGRAV